MPLGTTWPSGTGGLAGPKPVPHRIMVSPGSPGAVVMPRVPLAAAGVKSTCVATAWFAGQAKKAGWMDCELIGNGVLAPAEVVTVTVAAPLGSAGVRTLIWVEVTAAI